MWVPKDFVWLVVCLPSIKVPIVTDCSIRISVQTQIKSLQNLPRIAIMAAKLFVIACILAAANAGYIGVPSALQYHEFTPIAHVEPHAITSTSDNILRSPGNLAQVATQTKTIDTPFSSSSKTDIRVTNPAVTTYAHLAHPAPLTYAAAALPAAVRPAALGVAYSPAVEVSHMSYSSPIGIAYAY
ncbi:PREDICTED: cuticle protein 76-like [Wasmannia auropunctata]|uniref:cuticle protein 76-like n=1 Tax=Wasmannia auropunctata TaxID=64793 RepID=UPI0005F0B24B|nr:PREDICTED: cuticle protein 76-like [Wasmannia auropunctata]